MLAAVQVTGVPMLKGREREARVFLSLSAEETGVPQCLRLPRGWPALQLGLELTSSAGNLEIGSLPLLSKSSLS